MNATNDRLTQRYGMKPRPEDDRLYLSKWSAEALANAAGRIDELRRHAPALAERLCEDICEEACRRDLMKSEPGTIDADFAVILDSDNWSLPDVGKALELVFRKQDDDDFGRLLDALRGPLVEAASDRLKQF